MGLGALLAAGVVAGAGVWAGAASQGIDVGVGRLLGAGLNVVPTAALVLGMTALVLAVAPRAAVPIGYAIAASSLLTDLVSSFSSALHWFSYAGVFHYLALLPAAPFAPQTVVAVCATGVVCCAAATWLFARRDLTTG